MLAPPSADRPPPRVLRAALRLVGLIAPFVPASRRQGWREQWAADLMYAAPRETPAALMRQALGALPHACWLRFHDWRGDMFLHDVRYALRTLLKRPTFTLVAVLILGLGIGANATIFSWVETVVLRPLSGVRAQDWLFVVNGTSETRANLSLSYPNYVDIKAALPPSVTDLMAFRIVALNLKIGQAPQRAWGTLTTANYFDLLGVKPALGRTFVRDDDRAPGASPVAVVSHEFWERVFGGAPEVVGRTIQVNGRPFTVIGVAPAGFHGPPSGMRSDLWLPMMMQQAVVPGDRLHARGNGWLEGVARLAPGATLAQAQAALDVVARRLVTIDPKVNAGRGLGCTRCGARRRKRAASWRRSSPC